MTGFSALPVADEDKDDLERRWTGVARVVGPRWTHLPSITVGLLGVQTLWSVEMTYASPYLISLGLSKSLMAMVILAGPLSGLIVQPLIGILADNSKSRFGRRRPFILVGTALCALATLLLGFTRPFASLFTNINTSVNDNLTIWLAIFAIYCMDFTVNVVQALDRALLVDILPTTKQPSANAWAASMVAVGSVAGSLAGYLDLPHIFPFFGTAQIQVLSVLAALLLFASQAWVCLHVKERILISSSSTSKGLGQELAELWCTLFRLPRVIRQICWIQFFAWLGWFPVLFYSTVYIGDLHKRSSPIPQTPDAAIALDEESTRLGTRAMFYNALVSLVINIILLSLVSPQHAQHSSSPLEPKRKSWSEYVRTHLAILWAWSHFIFAACMAATFITSSVFGATMIISVTGFCWAMTQWAPFALLGEAILSYPDSDGAGSIHLVDTRTTHNGWTYDGHGADEETQQLFRADEEENMDGPDFLDGHHPLHTHNSSISSRSIDQDEDDSHLKKGILGHARARTSRINFSSAAVLEEGSQGHAFMDTTTSGLPSKPEGGNGLSAQAGAILGIHNLFLCIPQFIMIGLSSILFALLDPPQSVLHSRYSGGTPPQSSNGISASTFSAREDALAPAQGTDTIVIIFRIGGVAAAIAFVLCYRFAKELKRS